MFFCFFFFFFFCGFVNMSTIHSLTEIRLLLYSFHDVLCFTDHQYEVQVLRIKHKRAFEPANEIMVRFVLRKLILQTRMRNHPKELDV